MNSVFLKFLTICCLLLMNIGEIHSQNIASFESISLQENSFLNGSEKPLGTYYQDGHVILPNVYQTDFGGFWQSGWAISNISDTITVGFGNLYASCTGSGFSYSKNYAVGTQNSILTLDDVSQGKELAGCYITNGTYAAISMKNGDAFAKKFGGKTGDDSDFFKLKIQKYLNGHLGSESVEFYLADFRHTNSHEDYIIDDWTFVDLSTLGQVDSLIFSLTSSDNGDFGMNTPAYFCLDHFELKSGISNSEEKSNVLNYRVFPNPASNLISIDGGNSQNKIQEYEILNLFGQSIYKSNFNKSTTLDVSFLNIGWYILKINDDTPFIKTFLKI